MEVIKTLNLYNNDCFDVLDSLKADVVFTSPPFNRKRNDKYKNYDDIINNYYDFLVTAIDKCISITSKYVIFNLQANYYNRSDVYKIIGHYSDNIQNIIIWEKSNPLPANGNNITNSYEFFIVIGNIPIKSNTTYTKNHITTSVNSQSTTKIHKAVMKQEVSDWFIENFTKENDIVLDCFMGLGTTGISCVKYNRGFIGIEKNKEYFDIAKQRIKLVYK